jgi:hypothetical protein
MGAIFVEDGHPARSAREGEVMTTTSGARQRIESYLTRLRAALRGVNNEDAREIVEEMRSHIIDKASASGDLTVTAVDDALASLGSPEELAREYKTDALLARAEASRSPIRIIDGLFRWAGLSVAGFFVLLLAITGYFFGGLFIVLAVLKPFYPAAAGLWISRDSTGDLAISLHLGLGTVPSGAREVLGWWIVPIGLLAGCGLVMLTTRLALWCVRQYRIARTLPRV